VSSPICVKHVLSQPVAYELESENSIVIHDDAGDVVCEITVGEGESEEKQALADVIVNALNKMDPEKEIG